MSLHGVIHQSTAPTADTATGGARSATTALNANGKRTSWGIKNVSGSNPLFIKFGESASTSDYHTILAPGSGAADGLGGSFEQTAGNVYSGIVTVAGTSPQYSIFEFEEEWPQ